MLPQVLGLGGEEVGWVRIHLKPCLFLHLSVQLEGAPPRVAGEDAYLEDVGWLFREINEPDLGGLSPPGEADCRLQLHRPPAEHDRRLDHEGIPVREDAHRRDVGGLIEDETHGAELGVIEDEHHAPAETRIPQVGRGHQESAGEGVSIGFHTVMVRPLPPGAGYRGGVVSVFSGVPMLRIGLMGLGRIGRNLFRQLLDHPSLEIVAICDIADPEALTYLLKYDSIYGRLDRPVRFTDGALHVDDRVIPFVPGRAPGDVDWAAAKVDVVVQAVGRYRTRVDVEKHLAAGAGRVVLASTPETPGDLPILIPGINDEILTPRDRVMAMGSNTAHAVGPVLRILDTTFGLKRAYFTTVHAFTASQRLADVPTEGFRTSRAAGENIIPSPTNSPEILTQVLPELEGKIRAMALNVPVPDGSTVDLVAHLERRTSVAEVNAAIRSATEGRFAGILEYTEDPIVSSDVIGSPASGVFDSLATMVMGDDLAKLIIWFDNGWGYTARIVEALERIDDMKEEGA